jgi:SAM-dependent methyltransferase
MESWTSEIKNIFKTLNKILDSEFEKYTFIDIGCGKGKVGIIWTICCRKLGKKQEIFGIDLLEEIIVIAKKNSLKILVSEGKNLTQDVIKINPSEFGKKFILYLYNPFDDFVFDNIPNDVIRFFNELIEVVIIIIISTIALYYY